MLRGEGQYADMESQKVLPAQYFDQVSLCALRAWRSPNSQTAQISLSHLRQKPQEQWVEFLAQVRRHIETKVSHLEGAQILIKQLACEGSNPECRAASAPVKKNQDLSSWVSAI